MGVRTGIGKEPAYRRWIGGSLACALALLAGCPNEGGVACVEVTGCPGICCESATHCRRQLCQGLEYTCMSFVQETGEVQYGWAQGTVTCPAVDGAVPLTDGNAPLDIALPLPDGCLCLPGTSRPCGACALGSQPCKADCSGYETGCELPAGVCQPGTKEDCPNLCGRRNCLPDCTWGDCSKVGVPVATTGNGCWDLEYCPPGSPNGPARCVDCWVICAADGSTYEEEWCAGANCQSCTPIDPSCK